MKENQTTFTILFWVCKSRLKGGKAPISARVTVNGQRTEISTNRSVSPLEWDSKNQLCTTKGAEGRALNNHLAVVKGKLVGCYSLIETANGFVTVDAIKRAYSGVSEKPRMLFEIIEQHNNYIKALLCH